MVSTVNVKHYTLSRIPLLLHNLYLSMALHSNTTTHRRVGDPISLCWVSITDCKRKSLQTFMKGACSSFWIFWIVIPEYSWNFLKSLPVCANIGRSKLSCLSAAFAFAATEFAWDPWDPSDPSLESLECVASAASAAASQRRTMATPPATGFSHVPHGPRTWAGRFCSFQYFQSVSRFLCYWDSVTQWCWGTTCHSGPRSCPFCTAPTSCLLPRMPLRKILRGCEDRCNIEIFLFTKLPAKGKV